MRPTNMPSGRTAYLETSHLILSTVHLPNQLNSSAIALPLSIPFPVFLPGVYVINMTVDLPSKFEYDYLREGNLGDTLVIRVSNRLFSNLHQSSRRFDFLMMLLIWT